MLSLLSLLGIALTVLVSRIRYAVAKSGVLCSARARDHRGSRIVRPPTPGQTRFFGLTYISYGTRVAGGGHATSVTRHFGAVSHCCAEPKCLSTTQRHLG
jgi:hypothetical protein